MLSSFFEGMTPTDIAHQYAEGAVALSGLPPNLEGQYLSAPGGSSPTSPVTPADSGIPDTDVVEKQFVTAKLIAPSRISFKALKYVFNQYKNDVGKEDYNDFKELENDWTVAPNKQKRDIAHIRARELYKSALFDARY